MLGDTPVVAFDLETTGLRPYIDKVIAIGVGGLQNNSTVFVVVVPHEIAEESIPQVDAWLWSKTRRAVAHNWKYDAQFFAKTCGAIPSDALIGDTLLLGHLLDERPNRDNARCRGLGLKDVASVRYDVENYAWDWKTFYASMARDAGTTESALEHTETRAEGDAASTRIEADWDGLYRYLSFDVAFTARLWRDLKEEASAESPRLLEAHDTVLMPAARALSGCELAGAPLDREWLQTFARRLRQRIDRRGRALERTAYDLGFPPDAKINSPKEIADVMYDVWRMTPDTRRRKGLAPDAQDRSTDREHIEAAIAKYIHCDDEALVRAARWLRSLLKWRADQKNLSTYSESLLERMDDDGRVRAGFLLHGTATGRLSSRDPNIQNIPAVDDKIVVNGRTVYVLRGGARTHWPARRAFAAPPGYLIVEADFKQIELRVAAALSGDEGFTQVFVEGRDIHREVAASLFSTPAEEITKPERYLAKAVSLGAMYGRTGKAIANGPEMDFLERTLGGKRWDVPTAEAFVRKFWRGYPRLEAWFTEQGENALHDGFVESPFGRRRRFPFTPRTKYEQLEIRRKAANSPIQSAASDICLLAMVRVADRLPDGATVLAPIHDSILLEVREDLLPEVKTILQEEMVQVFMGVPLDIDVEVGENWADTH